MKKFFSLLLLSLVLVGNCFTAPPPVGFLVTPNPALENFLNQSLPSIEIPIATQLLGKLDSDGYPIDFVTIPKCKLNARDQGLVVFKKKGTGNKAQLIVKRLVILAGNIMPYADILLEDFVQFQADNDCDLTETDEGAWILAAITKDKHLVAKKYDAIAEKGTGLRETKIKLHTKVKNAARVLTKTLSNGVAVIAYQTTDNKVYAIKLNKNKTTLSSPTLLGSNHSLESLDVDGKGNFFVASINKSTSKALIQKGNSSLTRIASKTLDPENVSKVLVSAALTGEATAITLDTNGSLGGLVDIYGTQTSISTPDFTISSIKELTEMGEGQVVLLATTNDGVVKYMGVDLDGLVTASVNLSLATQSLTLVSLNKATQKQTSQSGKEIKTSYKTSSGYNQCFTCGEIIPAQGTNKMVGALGDLDGFIQNKLENRLKEVQNKLDSIDQKVKDALKKATERLRTASGDAAAEYGITVSGDTFYADGDDVYQVVTAQTVDLE